MLGLKKWGTDLVLKAKGLFTSPESQVYVKDLRKVMVYNDGRKCQYPQNYDQIVRSCEIKKAKDSNNRDMYELYYGGYKYDLISVLQDEEGKSLKIEDKSYFTIKFLTGKNKDRYDDNDDYSKFYKPFKFEKFELEKCLPIFEVDTKSLELTNSSFLAKEGCFVNNKTEEVDEEDRDEKGRNGELLYTSDYKKLNTSFSEVRDQNGNLELDKSLISVPIVFVAGLAKICAKLLTFIPMKLGEYVINTQNPIAKFFGYLLFTPAMAVKNLVNMGATVLKTPILLFVANEKKYGDAYLTMWKHQWKGCWEETKSDYSVVENGERSESEKKDYSECKIAGTWKELDARRSAIEGDLEKELSKTSESIDKPEEPNVGELKEELQSEHNEEIDVDVDQESNTPHIDREKRRNSQPEAPSRS